MSLLRLDEHSALAIKVRLEQEDPTGRYLLYAPFEPLAPDHLVITADHGFLCQETPLGQSDKSSVRRGGRAAHMRHTGDGGGRPQVLERILAAAATSS